MSGLVALLNNKWHPPAPTTQSFSGKTILITGTSGGLGLEAAKKLAALNATKLIITARSVSRAEETKTKIEEWLKAENHQTNTEIVALPLDMSSAEGIKTFLPLLKSATKKLDCAVLNAGTIQSSHHDSADGFEETIQVNAVSTTFLAVELLPILIATAESTSKQTQLTFVSSSNAMRVPPAGLNPIFEDPDTKPILEMSKSKYFPNTSLGGQTLYARSKLILEYAMRHMAALPSIRGGLSSSSTTGKTDEGQDVKVLINSTCPGMCVSDLGRQYDAWHLRLATWIVFTFFARTTEQGANSYISALTRGDEGHGKLWRHDQLEKEWDLVKDNGKGKEYGDRVWAELKELMVGWDPEVKKVI